MKRPKHNKLVNASENIGQYKRAVDKRIAEANQPPKLTKRQLFCAERMGNYILGKLEEGATDMPARLWKGPFGKLLAPYEESATVREVEQRLEAQGIGVDFYSTSPASHHSRVERRIAVTHVLDKIIEPSGEYERTRGLSRHN